MVWQFVMGAVNALEGISNSDSKMKLAKSQHNLESGRANNKFMMQAANNTLAAANAEVDRFNQERNNKQAMKGLENGMEADAFNTGKQVDAINNGRFEERMASAAALGTLAATAAAAGVGGGSVENLSRTEEMRAERVDAGIANNLKDAGYMQALNQSGMMDGAYNALDDTLIVPGFDYTARDFVMDTTMQHEWSIGKGAMDFGKGFMGNMDQLGGGDSGGVNLSGAVNQGMFGSGSKNKGLGQGGKIGAPKQGGNTGGMGMGTSWKSYTRL